MSADLLAPLSKRFATRLSTRKRDGSQVHTPVNMAVDGDRAYFGTGANTGKVKRLRNFADVALTPCTAGGRPRGAPVLATARLLDGEEAADAHRRLKAKNPILVRLMLPLDMAFRRTHVVFYELTDVRAPSSAPSPEAVRDSTHSLEIDHDRHHQQH